MAEMMNPVSFPRPSNALGQGLGGDLKKVSSPNVLGGDFERSSPRPSNALGRRIKRKSQIKLKWMTTNYHIGYIS